MAIGVIGILIAVAILVFAVYKGCAAYYVAPLAALVVFVTNNMVVRDSFKIFTDGLAKSASGTFFIILCGAILGQLYTATGAANTLANTIFGFFQKRGATEKAQRFFGLLVVYLVGGALSMAGVSGFVCVMTVFPIALSILTQLNVSRRCLPIVTFAPTCFALVCPASPQIYNSLATRIMGVNGAAGLIPGLAGALVIEVGGFLYVLHLMNKHSGEGFAMTEQDRSYLKARDKTPGFVVSVLPIFIVFFVYNVLHWAVYVAVSIAALFLLVTCYKYIGNGSAKASADVLGNACRIAAYNIGNVCAISGFGAVVVAAPAFNEAIQAALKSNMHPLVLLAVVIALLTGATSSATASFNAALAEIGALVTASGVSAAAVSRVASCAAATLDTLPTNGVVLMINDLTGMTHKETYFPIAVVTVILTTVATAVAVALFILNPGFV